MAFGIDNEGHYFPRASRGYTPHKICLHSWKTHHPRSTEVAQGLRHFVDDATPAPRSTDAPGILLGERGEQGILRALGIHLPSRTFSLCFIDTDTTRKELCSLK